MSSRTLTLCALLSLASCEVGETLSHLYRLGVGTPEEAQP